MLPVELFRESCSAACSAAKDKVVRKSWSRLAFKNGVGLDDDGVSTAGWIVV